MEACWRAGLSCSRRPFLNHMSETEAEPDAIVVESGEGTRMRLRKAVDVVLARHRVWFYILFSEHNSNNTTDMFDHNFDPALYYDFQFDSSVIYEWFQTLLKIKINKIIFYLIK